MSRLKSKNCLLTIVATIALVMGVMAPSFAASKSGTMTNWGNKHTSPNWKDKSKGKSSVTFSVGCTREFRATIRKNLKLRPDPKLGREWINCQSYTDAVRGKYSDPGTFHFDVTGMGYVCYSGNCISKSTSGKYKIKW